MKPMRAQFAGSCSQCHGVIAVGARIRRGPSSWVHQDCNKAADEVIPEPAVASPERRRTTGRALDLAHRVMKRAGEQLATVRVLPSWRDQLPTNVRMAECWDCASQDLEFEASNEGYPHWQLACRCCGVVTSFPSRPLRSGRQGTGFQY